MSSEPTLPLLGGCGCGAVTFALKEAPIAAAYCHCRRCQHRTGTAVQASAKIDPDSITIAKGEQHLRGWEPPGGLEKVFCELCGSHLFGRDAETGAITVVRMAAFDDDPGVRPAAHQFVAYAAPWEEIRDDGLPRFDERIPNA